MPTINREVIVPYSASEMYRLVNAIEDYPEFLPGCDSSTIHERDSDEVRATIVVGWKGIHKSFTTCNRLQPEKMMEIRLINGPFHHLEGFWRFENIENGSSKVTLDVEFEIAGKLFSLAFGPIFNQFAHTLVDSFTRRAETVYGKRE